MSGVFGDARLLDEADLAGFLITWCNNSDPDVCEQALQFWSENARAFGPAYSQRRVTPGKPPSYPRR
jgi:hypothetical protein